MTASYALLDTYERLGGPGSMAEASSRFQQRRVRCACRRCGSHVQAVVLKQTISGRCGTCTSYDIAPLGE